VSNLDFLSKLLGVLDEAIFPILAAWAVMLLRQMLRADERDDAK